MVEADPTGGVHASKIDRAPAPLFSDTIGTPPGTIENHELDANGTCCVTFRGADPLFDTEIVIVDEMATNPKSIGDATLQGAMMSCGEAEHDSWNTTDGLVTSLVESTSESENSPIVVLTGGVHAIPITCACPTSVALVIGSPDATENHDPVFNGAPWITDRSPTPRFETDTPALSDDDTLENEIVDDGGGLDENTGADVHVSMKLTSGAAGSLVVSERLSEYGDAGDEPTGGEHRTEIETAVDV